MQLQRRHRQPLRFEQDNQRSGDAEDGARGSRASRKRCQVVGGDPFRVILRPVDEGGQQVARRAGEDVDRQQAQRTHQRLGQQTQIPQAPHIGGQVQNAHMDEHGGDNAPPLPVNQHVARIVGAPEHQLVEVGADRADVMRNHGQKNQAIDAHQKISGRRVSPRRALPAGRTRRWRIESGLRRQKLRFGIGVHANGLLFAGRRNRGVATHSTTLMHFGVGLEAERVNRWPGRRQAINCNRTGSCRNRPHTIDVFASECPIPGLKAPLFGSFSGGRSLLLPPRRPFATVALKSSRISVGTGLHP